jgi:Protein of unknown function (DUF1579)
MASLDALAALAGTWRGTYELRGDPSFDSDTPSTAIVTAILGGRFVRIDYSWDEGDQLQENGPQEGSLLIGFEPEPEPGIATVTWIDSWHNGRRTMVCPGVGLDSGGVDVRGTYPGGPGNPDWGWRTLIEPAADRWTLTMFNVTPEGEESLAVRAAYSRVDAESDSD